MERNKSHRHINFDSEITCFKPRGFPMKMLEEIKLERDKLEAIRLKNDEGLYRLQKRRGFPGRLLLGFLNLLARKLPKHSSMAMQFELRMNYNLLHMNIFYDED